MSARLLGDEVLVLDGAGRQLDPGQPADVAGPDAGGVDDDLGLDVALRRCATRVARRSLTSIAVTRTRSTMRTPPARAPLA